MCDRTKKISGHGMRQKCPQTRCLGGGVHKVGAGENSKNQNFKLFIETDGIPEVFRGFSPGADRPAGSKVDREIAAFSLDISRIGV